jgi:hypothetical protein
MPEYAGKGLRFAPKGCHSSPGLKAWGFLAWLIKFKFKIYFNRNDKLSKSKKL